MQFKAAQFSSTYTFLETKICIFIDESALNLISKRLYICGE